MVDQRIYIEDPVWGLAQKEIAEFLPLWRMPDKPPVMSLPVMRSGRLLYYNQSWAKELGFSNPPKTINEFRQQACAAAKSQRDDAIPSNDGQGGWIISNHYTTVLGWLHAFDADIMTDAQQYQMDTPLPLRPNPSGQR